MNIIYTINISASSSMMGQWQIYHIVSELRDNGMDVCVFNFNAYESLDMANDALLMLAKKRRPDLITCPYNERVLYIETLNELSKCGIATLLICFDNLVEPYVHKRVAKHYSLAWLTSRETEKYFKNRGAATVFLPYAANPSLCMPSYSNNINRICFIGTPYGARKIMLNQITDNHIPLDIYYDEKSGNVPRAPSRRRIIGSSVKKLMYSPGRRLVLGSLQYKLSRDKSEHNSETLSRYPSVAVHAQGKIYSNYSLSLASTCARNTIVMKKPVPIVNLRSFEIPMCGGVQFCMYNRELSAYFEEGKEIVFYRSRDELREKAVYYLNEKRCAEIGAMKRNARLRAENAHTWMHRFQKAFDVLGL